MGLLVSLFVLSIQRSPAQPLSYCLKVATHRIKVTETFASTASVWACTSGQCLFKKKNLTLNEFVHQICICPTRWRLCYTNQRVLLIILPSQKANQYSLLSRCIFCVCYNPFSQIWSVSWYCCWWNCNSDNLFLFFSFFFFSFLFF